MTFSKKLGRGNLIDYDRRPRWLMGEIIQRLGELFDFALALDPDGVSGFVGGRETIIREIGGGGTTVVVQGASGLVIENTENFIEGELVHVNKDGAAFRADKTTVDSGNQPTRLATHCVGSVTGDGKAVLFNAWASGPVRVDSAGSGSVLWLGTGGRATRVMPGDDDAPAGYVGRQVIGTIIGRMTGGVATAQLMIESRPERI